jgi:hypothetical protein
MKCPHCEKEVAMTAAGLPAACPRCGRPLATPVAGLVVQPPDQKPTRTELILGILGMSCEAVAVGALIVTVCSLPRGLLPPMGVAVGFGMAVGFSIHGLLLLAMAHVLRYLRLTVNSLASMRARPLGSKTDE